MVKRISLCDAFVYWSVNIYVSKERPVKHFNIKLFKTEFFVAGWIIIESKLLKYGRLCLWAGNFKFWSLNGTTILNFFILVGDDSVGSSVTVQWNFFQLYGWPWNFFITFKNRWGVVATELWIIWRFRKKRL